MLKAPGTTIKPFAAFLTIRPDKVETSDVTSGGIIKPDIIQEDAIPRFGIVVAVGPDVTRCTVGEHVLFSAHAGNPIEVDGEELLFMAEMAVVAGV